MAIDCLSLEQSDINATSMRIVAGCWWFVDVQGDRWAVALAVVEAVSQAQQEIQSVDKRDTRVYE